MPGGASGKSQGRAERGAVAGANSGCVLEHGKIMISYDPVEFYIDFLTQFHWHNTIYIYI